MNPEQKTPEMHLMVEGSWVAVAGDVRKATHTFIGRAANYACGCFAFRLRLPTPTRKALQHKSLNPKNRSAPNPLTLKIPTAPKPYNQFSAGQVAVAPSHRKPHPEGPKCAARARGPSAGAIRIGERCWGYIMQKPKP